MPCMDGREHDYRTDPTVQRRLDFVTRVACEVFHQMTPASIALLSDEAKQWWAAHQEMDRRRLAAEQAENQRRLLRARALKKLTKEEKQALRL